MKSRRWEFARRNDTVLFRLHPHGGRHLTPFWEDTFKPLKQHSNTALSRPWKVAAWDLHDCIQRLRLMQTLETFGNFWKTQEIFRKIRRSLTVTQGIDNLITISFTTVAINPLCRITREASTTAFSPGALLHTFATLITASKRTYVFCRSTDRHIVEPHHTHFKLRHYSCRCLYLYLKKTNKKGGRTVHWTLLWRIIHQKSQQQRYNRHAVPI